MLFYQIKVDSIVDPFWILIRLYTDEENNDEAINKLKSCR